ncbi:apoptosis-inducing factor 3-like isoform X2 [Coregonus clupeaformis]|uniref:apoptosis-inducing factor 3-like isoform X2 n=1 Tax=Coregonus clupeaformis TaxID=59861 RepID=UPI001E1C6C25|nr:apoptosis-inducing factor 3-like isoform X2 [Coregonus clupeaformis]
MGGCLSKSKPVEVKVELTLLDKEKEADVKSPNGKASPFSDCRPNGALEHFSDEDSAAAALRLYKPSDYLEASVCHVKDLENGQMREVDLGSGRVLLIKEHGEFSAIGHKCPHYGAPLVKGVLSKGHVRCPWHGACFNIATGDIEDFPGLDSLPTFQVRVEKDKVIVRANKQDLQSQKRSKAMARCSAVNSSTGFSHVLIVGSGPAGLVCAETLRQEGFPDRIVMCTMDKHPPYDRPKLSKSLESTAEQLRLRSIDFLQAHDIELLTEKEAVAVDVKTRAVTFQDGSRMEYRKLFIATGSKPKPMNYKGQDVRNVFHLRTPEDANSVARLANNKNAVIVGTSFVGMEVAAALTDKAHSVSIIGKEAIPFRKALGEKVGKAIMKLFETNRVKFYMLNEVSEMLGHDGQLKEVVLKSGKVLRADVCVIGTGSGPATGFLKQSGVHMDSKGFVPVSKTMQTNVDGVFAGGDIVTFPFPGRSNKKVNIPHWQMAHVHGRAAALGIMGRPTEIKTVPYFWSAMFGKSLRYADLLKKVLLFYYQGYGEGFDDVIIQGDVDELKFVAFYTRSEEVVAVASINYDPIVSRVAEVLGSGKTIRKRDVETGDMSWLIDKGSQ